MIKDVLKFDAETAFSPIRKEIRYIVDNGQKNYEQLYGFTYCVSDSGIFGKCNGCHELFTQEKALRDYIGEIAHGEVKMTRMEYESCVKRMQKSSMEALKSNCVWLPITYPIFSLMLYYSFSDLKDYYSDERDPNVDDFSARQVIKALKYTLQEIRDAHGSVVQSLIRNEIKTGYETVVDEYVCMKKYYYIDLDGRRYSKYNSAADRDKAVDKYVADTYAAYEKRDTGMIKLIDNLISQVLNNFQMIK